MKVNRKALAILLLEPEEERTLLAEALRDEEEGADVLLLITEGEEPCRRLLAARESEVPRI